jgi:hypothetical protein
VIGGSKFTSGPSVEILVTPHVAAKSGKWSASVFVLASALLFGGAAGNWFGTGLSSDSLAIRTLQLSAGSLGMGAVVAIFGSMIFGRNPIRWGIGMPFLVYLGGTMMALVAGRDGASTLLYGAPLFLGLSFAAGVMSAFLIDGLFARGQRD